MIYAQINLSKGVKKALKRLLTEFIIIDNENGKTYAVWVDSLGDEIEICSFELIKKLEESKLILKKENGKYVNDLSEKISLNEHGKKYVRMIFK